MPMLEEMTYLADVGGDEIADELLHVAVDSASLLDGGDDRREVVVSQHHLRSRLRHRRARSHRNADLGLLQRRSVVYTVTGLHVQTSHDVTTPHIPVRRSHRHQSAQTRHDVTTPYINLKGIYRKIDNC